MNFRVRRPAEATRTGHFRMWRATAACLVAMLGAMPVSAQTAYPIRTLRIIVPYTPAGTTDILARAIGQKFTAAWSQPVLVDNRPGASGNIGTEAAAKAAPDGYTLLMGTVVTHGINPALYPKLQFDAVRDFVPVSLAAMVPNIVVVANALPAKNLADLITYAKANPGKLTYGSPGQGSTGHLSTELFEVMAGIVMTHVPSKGRAHIRQDLEGGKLQVVIDSLPPYLPQVRAGKIRALAVTTPKRSPVAPQLPTVAEAGVKDYEASSWYGLFAPAGTPPEIVATIAAEVRRMLQMSDMRDRLLGIGAQPAEGTPDEFAAFVRSEVAKWGQVIRDAGVRIE